MVPRTVTKVTMERGVLSSITCTNKATGEGFDRLESAGLRMKQGEIGENANYCAFKSVLVKFLLAHRRSL